MEKKMTLGPWEIEVRNREEYWFPVSHHNVGPAIGIESEADANLISAAPDLLEAIETLLDCFVNDPLGWMDSSDIAIEKAYDAIHKAKGE